MELSENQVLNITVESPVKFSEVVYHICRQAGGEEGEFILSDIEKELSMEKRTVVVNNPLTVNCEEKKGFYLSFIKIFQKKNIGRSF